MGKKVNSSRWSWGRIVLWLLFLPTPFVNCGCFGAAVGTALGLLGGGEGSSGGIVEPPVPLANIVAEGPYVLLEQEPRGVVLGDFLPEEASGPPHLDAAVSFEDQRLVAFFRGDGSGRLVRVKAINTFLRGSKATAIATLPVQGPAGDPGDALVVATPNTLEVLRRQASSKTFTQTFFLFGEEETRDLAIGDFTGGGSQDIAVTSQEASRVDFFTFKPGAENDQLQLLGSLELNGPPQSLTAADFYPDPEGRADLAVIVKRLEKDHLDVYFARQETDGVKWCTQPDLTLELPDPTRRLAKRPYLAGDKLAPIIGFIRADGTGTVIVHRPEFVSGLGNDPRHGTNVVEDQPPPFGPLLDCTPLSGLELELNNRGGGHFSPGAVAISLLHLPGGTETLDRVTLDRLLGSVECSYFASDGLDVTKTISYKIPGTGKDLAVGDLNGDGHEDIAVVAGGQDSVLLTLVATKPADAIRKPCPAESGNSQLPDDVKNDPFFVPRGLVAGESQRNAPALLDIGFGQAGVGENEPFIVGVDRTNEEASVFFLDPMAGVTRVERYPGLSDRPASVAVGQMDGQNGDDIVVGATDAVYFLRSETIKKEGDLHFSIEQHLLKDLVAMVEDDTINQEITGDLKNKNISFRFRDVTAGNIEGQIGPFILLPLERTEKDAKQQHGFVILFLNPASSEAKVRAVRTPAGPRQATLGNLNLNLNKTPALDLIVACDKENGIFLVNGDPLQPGTFFDRGEDRPVFLPAGGNESVEVQDVATDNNPFVAGKMIDERRMTPSWPWPRVKWLLASLRNQGLSLYCQSEDECGSSPQSPFCTSRMVHNGKDDEAILVFDLFEDPDELLDLAVVDEAEAGKVIFLKNTGTSNKTDGCPEWTIEGELQVGSPQRVIPFHIGGLLHLAVASRSHLEIQVFQRSGCPKNCTFIPVNTIPVRPSLKGSRLGLSVHSVPGVGILAASLVEDEQVSQSNGKREITVDLVLFRGPDLNKVGAAQGPASKCRYLLNADRLPSGILLGNFIGDDAVDLLACYHDPNSNKSRICCYKGRWEDGMPVLLPGTESMPGLAKETEGELVDWELFAGAKEQRLLLIATEKQLFLHRLPLPPNGEEVSFSRVEGRIHQATHGWAHENRKVDPFLVILDDKDIAGRKVKELAVEFTHHREELFKLDSASDQGLQTLDRIGARDLNGDHHDDVVFVEAGTLSVHVFLARRDEPEKFEENRSFGYTGFHEPVDVGFLDANGDGNHDICFGSSSGEVLVFLGNGHGSFSKQEGPPPAVLFAGPDLEALRVVNFGGDGLDEVILASVATPGLVVLSPRVESDEK